MLCEKMWTYWRCQRNQAIGYLCVVIVRVCSLEKDCMLELVSVNSTTLVESSFALFSFLFPSCYGGGFANFSYWHSSDLWISWFFSVVLCFAIFFSYFLSFPPLAMVFCFANFYSLTQPFSLIIETFLDHARFRLILSFVFLLALVGFL